MRFSDLHGSGSDRFLPKEIVHERKCEINEREKNRVSDRGHYFIVAFDRIFMPDYFYKADLFLDARGYG